VTLLALLAQATPSPAPPAGEAIPTPELVFQPILPVLIVCAAGIVGMLYEAFARRGSRGTHLAIVLVGLAAAAAAALRLWSWTGALTVMGDTVVADRFSVLATVILAAIAGFGSLYHAHEAAAGRAPSRGDFYPLLAFATAGMMLIAAANDLLVVFLALEILSLSLYVLSGMGGRRSREAAVKYFLLGAFSSAFFLYGVAMAYGATASTKVTSIVWALAGQTGSQGLAIAAAALLVIGFGFKVSAAPFHMWTPDVYQGAPTPVVAYMSAATKVAAFFALMRVFDVALQPLTLDWTPVIYALSVLSVLVGAILAATQQDVKRMLAYSSVAHAGFILAGLTSANATGIRAAMFYLVAYSVMTVGAFGVTMVVATDQHEPSSYDCYDGLAKRSPVLAALMTVFLLSLAGIPPTAGFIAKVGVFTAAIAAGNWPLALIGVLASVIAAYAYLRVIIRMYFREPQAAAVDDASALPRVLGLVLAVAVVFLGVFPRVLSSIIEQASILRW
jgi:NADH-quinone oxidoreductase subunit N